MPHNVEVSDNGKQITEVTVTIKFNPETDDANAILKTLAGEMRHAQILLMRMLKSGVE